MANFRLRFEQGEHVPQAGENFIAHSWSGGQPRLISVHKVRRVFQHTDGSTLMDADITQTDLTVASSLSASVGEQREPVTVADLSRVIIRAQDDKGHWDSISVAEATDKQFDAWARSRLEIQGDQGPWNMEERAEFCNRLWQADALYILKKDATDDTAV